MELFISFLLIGFFLLYFSANLKNLNQALIVYTSILFMVLGVYMLFFGGSAFSNSSLDTYTYSAGTLISISTTPISNTSPFIEILGLFSILSSIYLFFTGVFRDK